MIVVINVIFLIILYVRHNFNINTKLKSKDAFELLQVANKLETSITRDNDSLEKKTP